MRRRLILSVLSFSFICLILLSLSGCRPAGQKIAFFLYNGSDTFITEMMDNMKKGMKTEMEPEGVTFKVFDARNSQSVQNQQINELIDDNYDLFVINAVDRLASRAIVEKCKKEGIPVIFFNREPLDNALKEFKESAYYVGPDAASQGAKQAEIVAGLFADKFRDSQYDKNKDGAIQLAIIKGEQGHQDAEKRTEYCVKELTALGFSVETLAIEAADWNRKTGYRNGFEAMRRLYNQYGEKIELVFSNNDDMAIGAIEYLLSENIFSENISAEQQPFIIVGVDGTEVGLDYIKRGLLYGTVNNDSIKQSDAVLTLAKYMLNGINVKTSNDFPYKITENYFIYIDDIDGGIITQANVDEFIN